MFISISAYLIYIKPSNWKGCVLNTILIYSSSNHIPATLTVSNTFSGLSQKDTKLLCIQADMVDHGSIVCLWLSNPLMFYFWHALTSEIIVCPSHSQFSTDITDPYKRHRFLLLATCTGNLGVTCNE